MTEPDSWGFFFDKVALPLLFGALGFAVALLVYHLVTGPTVRRYFEHHNDELVREMQELIRDKNLVMLRELRIADLVERIGPEDRRRWASDALLFAQSVPPMLLAQVHRFGLAMPPPEMVERSHHTWTDWSDEEIRETRAMAVEVRARSAWNAPVSGD